MFTVVTEKNNLRVEGSELMTSGSVNVNYIQLNTSEDWLDLNRVILFRTNIVTIAIGIGIDDGTAVTMAIPWEVLETAGQTVQVGLYGTSKGDPREIVLPTIWGTIGKVVQGVYLSDAIRPGPTENLFLQLLNELDRLEHKIDDELIQFDYITPAEVDQIVARNEKSIENQNGR